MDNAKNFAKVTVSTGYDASATSIVLSTGHGAKLPTVPFNASWWNSTDYPDPSDDPNVEVIRVTAIATDTLTVTRAQEGTSASTKNTGGKTYKMIAGLTAKVINNDVMPNEFTTRGDMMRRGASAPERFAIERRGQYLASDGVDPKWAGPRNASGFVDDWNSGTTAGETNWGLFGFNSGTAAQINGDANRIGLIELQTLTNAAGGCLVMKGSASPQFLVLGNGSVLVRVRVRIPTLSDGTDRFLFYAGLSDKATAGGGEPSNGVYFVYSDNLNSGKWVCRSRSSSTNNDINDSGSAVGAGTDYTLEFVATNNSVKAYVNGTQIGSEITTGIPTAALRFWMQIEKTAGTTGRTAQVDYYEFDKVLTNTR
jgi:hypothetical protein